MKHELVECIKSEEVFVDLNDDVQFRKEKLSDLLTESKVVVYFPDYLLLVSSRQQLINLLDYALYLRNIGFFILVLFFLRRTSIHLEYIERKDKVVLISGWVQMLKILMLAIHFFPKIVLLIFSSKPFQTMEGSYCLRFEYRPEESAL